MNIWKRFLSLALVFALVLSMGPIIPFVQANAETETATAPAEEMVWDFDDGTAKGWARTGGTAGYAVTDGKLVWTSKNADQIASGAGANANNAQNNLLTIDGDDTWTSYEVSARVTVKNTTADFSHANFAPMAGFVVYYGSSATTNSIQIRVRPNQTANRYSITICTPGTAASGQALAKTVTVDGNVESTTGDITFDLKARVDNGIVTVYIDGCVAASVDVNAHYGKTFAGGVGIINWTTASTSTAAEMISYDNFTVAPIYVPETDMGGTVVAWYESANSNGIDTSLWTPNANYKITDGKIEATGSFNMSTPSAVKYNHFSIVADFTLPATAPTANTNVASLVAKVGSNQEYTIRFYGKSGAFNTELFLNDSVNGTTAADGRHNYGGAGQGTRVPKKLADQNGCWGNTYTAKMTRIGNWLHVTFTEKSSGTLLHELTYNLNPEYSVVTGGVYFTVNAVSGVMIDNVIATSYDSVAGELTLPEGITADAKPELTNGLETGAKLDTFSRTHYAAGETVELTVDTSVLDITTLKVNGDADTVNVDGNKVTFTMPAGDATITCEERQLPATETLDFNDGKTALDTDIWNGSFTSNGTVLSGSGEIMTKAAYNSGWIEAEITLPAADKVSTSSATFYLLKAKSSTAGSNTLEARIWFNKTTVPVFNLIVRGNNGATTKTACTYNLTSNDCGKTFKIRMAKVGDTVTVVLLDSQGKALKEYTTSIEGLLGSTDPSLLWADSTKLHFGLNATNNAAGFSNVKVGRFNKTFAVDLQEGSNITITAPAGRTQYVAGETVTLTVDTEAVDIATLKVNGGAVETNVSGNKVTFVMPEGNVTVTCGGYVFYNVNVIDGVTSTKATAKEGETVELTVDTSVLDITTLQVNGGDVNVNVDGNKVTFTMPAANVEITCDEKVTYKPSTDFGGKVVAWYESANSGNKIDTDLWTINTANYSINTETGKIVTTGAFKMNTGSANKYRNASIKATVTLPAEAPAAATNLAVFSALVNGNQSFNLRFRNSGTTVQGGFYMYDTLAANGTAAYGGPGDGSTNLSGNSRSWLVWGGTYHVEMYRIGNYIYSKITDASNSANNLVQRWCLNPAYQLETTSAYFVVEAGLANVSFDNIVVTSYDDVVSEVTLPAGMTADSLKEIGNGGLDDSGVQSFSRTHYAAGETVTLTVDTEALDIATLKVNGGAVETNVSGNTVTFVMPEGDVTVTCGGYVFYNVNVIDGVTSTKATAKEGETVELTIDTSVLDITTLQVNGGDVNVNVDGDKVTFTMPAGDATVTCEKKQLDPVESLTKYQPTTDVYYWSYSASTWKDGVVEVDIQLPTITAEQLAALREACTQNTGASSNPNYAVTIKTGSYSVTGTLYLWRNGSNSQLRFDTTAGLCAETNQRYLSANLDELFINGTLATFRIAKVGNFIQVQILDGNTVVADFSYTVPDGTAFTNATAWTVSVASTAGKVFTTCDPDTKELSNQLNTNAPIKRAEVKRINKAIAIETGTNVTLPVTYSVVDKTTKLARNAYYAGEIIVLNVAPNYAAYIGDEKITNPSAFVVPENDVVITAKPETDPYYVATDAILQYNPAGTAGGTKEWKLLAADYTATVENGYVVSTNITVYKQQKKVGEDTTVLDSFPWHGVEVNAVDFRVRPSSDATNSYYIGIRFGGAWVASDDGVVAATAMTSKVTIPGEKIVGADNEVTYNQAIKVENGVYTLYINGCAVCTYTNATATKGNVRVWSAKNGTLEGDNGNTWGFKVEYADMRIDRIGSVDEVTFGDKQLALDEDLAMDFHVALPTGTTATAAKITVGKVSTIVSLADAARKTAVDSHGMVGWYSWYVVTANVPVKDINTDVVVQLIDADGANVGSAYTYKVKTYVDYVISNGNNEVYAPFVAVAQSLADYGALASNYFADRSGTATLDEAVANRVNSVTVESVTGFAPERTGTNEQINLYGCSLVAEEKASICVYFKVGSAAGWNDADVSVNIGGVAVDNYVVEDVGNGYKRVRITGIHAADLDVEYTVVVNNAGGALTVTYSGLSYAYSVLNSATTSANLKAMAKSLYLYWDAAQKMN